MEDGLSHIDESGRVRMVDTSGKPDTLRTAVAGGTLEMSTATLSLIRKREMPKGDVFNTARIAGIMAAKRVDELVPLCHPLTLSHVSVEFGMRSAGDRGFVDIEASARLVGRTGVEMEALTAVAVAALTLYDMCKAVDGGMKISNIRLLEKSGGIKSSRRKKNR